MSRDRVLIGYLGDDREFFRTLGIRLNGLQMSVQEVSISSNASSVGVLHELGALIADADSLIGGISATCAELRSRVSELPILVCAHVEASVEAVAAYESNADDYFGKALDWTVIEARLRRILRRHHADRLSVSIRSLDQPQRTSRVRSPSETEVLPGIPLHQLTRTEELVLRTLKSRPSAVVSQRDITYAVWGSQAVEPKTLYAQISALKSKLTHSGWTIANARGKGYRLQPTSTCETDTRETPDA